MKYKNHTITIEPFIGFTALIKDENGNEVDGLDEGSPTVYADEETALSQAREVIDFSSETKPSTREWCNCCNNYSPVSFRVPDEIWNDVTMGKFQRLCIMCFAKRADERLIDWTKDIEFFPFSLASEIKPVIYSPPYIEGKTDLQNEG